MRFLMVHRYDKLQLDIFGVSYATVGCGLLDAPPKIGTIFGFSKGNYMNCLRQCDFALQNHRRVRDAAPYDFCRNVCAKLQFPSFAKNGEGVLPSPLRNQIISDAHPQRTVPGYPDRKAIKQRLDQQLNEREEKTYYTVITFDLAAFNLEDEWD